MGQMRDSPLYHKVWRLEAGKTGVLIQDGYSSLPAILNTIYDYSNSFQLRSILQKFETFALIVCTSIIQTKLDAAKTTGQGLKQQTTCIYISCLPPNFIRCSNKNQFSGGAWVA